MLKSGFFLAIFCSIMTWGQGIENAENLDSFKNKLAEKTSVTKVLFLGDSHIQAGWIPAVLRGHLSKTYGYAGRGVVFPYEVANSNGPIDVASKSSAAWQTFRLMYDQNYFKEMGGLGFVMGNHEDSFLEISFKNPEDAFDEVEIFNDSKMAGESFMIYSSPKPLASFVSLNKSKINYKLEACETFPEVAAKFNTTTYRIFQLNKNSIPTPRPNQVIEAKEGMQVQIEQVTPVLDASYQKSLTEIGQVTYNAGTTIFQYPKSTQRFILKTNAKEGNTFYGFQFRKRNVQSGTVLNTVGVNGATYADFLKYPLQMRQLRALNSDLVVVSLGTNESFLPNLEESSFKSSVVAVVNSLRFENANLPILILSPTDNRLEREKINKIVGWLREVAQEKDTAFLNMYALTGGDGYYQRSEKQHRTAGDGIHFVEAGYKDQGELIWKALQDYLGQ